MIVNQQSPTIMRLMSRPKTYNHKLPEPTDYYEVLGVSRDASMSEIKGTISF